MRSNARFSVWLGAIALVVPSLIWIARDRSVWSWDPSHYGRIALLIWNGALGGFSSLYSAMLTPSATAPLAYWFAAPFIALAPMTGRVERAISLGNVTLAIFSLVLIFHIIRSWTGSGKAASLGMITLAGMPLFFSSIDLFFAEMGQIFSATLMLFVAERATKVGKFELGLWLVFASSVAMLAKLSSMFFIAPLVAYTAIAVIVSSRVIKPELGLTRMISLIIAAVAALAGAIFWYWNNYEQAIAHAIRFSSTQYAEIYGTKADILHKFVGWADRTSASMSTWGFVPLCYFVVILAGICIAAKRTSIDRSRSKAFESGTAFAVFVLATILFVILVYSTQINEDVRFSAPLLPMIVALSTWSMFEIGKRWVYTVFGVIACANIAYTAGIALDILPVTSRTIYYLSPPIRNAGPAFRIQNAVLESCNDRSRATPIVVAVGLPDFNENSLTFESLKLQRQTGGICYYRTTFAYEDDVQKTIESLKTINPLAILTLPKKDIPHDPSSPFFYANRVAEPIADWLQSSSGYTPGDDQDPDSDIYYRGKN
ncbi:MULTISPECIES: glycosyltransferase family 39 protein [unclassified Rhizobium]